jgi:hypothetical protein
MSDWKEDLCKLCEGEGWECGSVLCLRASARCCAPWSPVWFELRSIDRGAESSSCAPARGGNFGKLSHKRADCRSRDQKRSCLRECCLNPEATHSWQSSSRSRILRWKGDVTLECTTALSSRPIHQVLLQQVLLLCCTNSNKQNKILPCVFTSILCQIKLVWAAKKKQFREIFDFLEDSAPLYLVLHNFQRTVIQQDYRHI